MTAAPSMSPWSIDFDACGVATLVREQGRIVERMRLKPAFSAEVAKLSRDQLTPGLISSLWRQAEGSPEDLIAERLVTAATMH